MSAWYSRLSTIVMILVVFLKIVSTGGFIDRGPAMQVVDDELAEFFFLLVIMQTRLFDVLIENKVVEDDPVHMYRGH